MSGKRAERQRQPEGRGQGRGARRLSEGRVRVCLSVVTARVCLQLRMVQEGEMAEDVRGVAPKLMDQQ